MDEGRRRWDAMGGAEPGEERYGTPKAQFVPVWLEAAGPDGGAQRPAVTVHVGRQRLGELSPGDGALLDRDLQAARQQDRTVWMLGRYFRRTAATRARLLLDPGTLPFPQPPHRSGRKR